MTSTKPEVEGPCIREAAKIWNSVAESEARTNLLKCLVREGRGVAELEEFNLGQINKFKSNKFKNKVLQQSKTCDRTTIPAMKVKLADEQCFLRELLAARMKYKKEFSRSLGQNTRKYKNTIADLKKNARKVKQEATEKYKMKNIHLRQKYKKTQEENQEQEAPEDIEEYQNCTIFNKKQYENLQQVKYKVKVIGQIDLTPEEEEILQLHPKFCIMDKLSRQEFECEQESALAKLRMETVKQEEYKEMTPSEVQEAQEIDAKARQVFDAVDKKYDARRKRATDLKECARITLPKPLSTDQEALLEMRKNTQKRIFEEYMRKHVDKNGTQETNLSQEQEKGLKSLQKKIHNGELIIIKTDKSSKFAVTNQQEYIRMGQEHTQGDIEIDRQEIIRIEENLNGHSRAWSQIWGAGEDHNHSSRIMTSKVTHSENVADMYLMYKDHKQGDKTRPTATGHSSNTLGMSNAVAEVLEAISNAEPNRYNTISSEDMLSRVHKYNIHVENKNMEYTDRALKKLNCRTCKIMEYIDCRNSEEHNWEEIMQSTWPPRGSPSPGTTQTSEDKNMSTTQLAVDQLLRQECCGTEIIKEISTDCTNCGPGVTRTEYSVIGTM